jgi:hypothetical protein
MSSNYDFEARLEALSKQVNSGFNDVGVRITALSARVYRIELNLARLAEHLNFELPYKPTQPPDERERRG